MAKILEAIKTDFNFIKSHKLQPAWFKVLKVVILLGGFAIFLYLFGLKETIIFFGVFFLLMLLVHMVYRMKTDRWQRSWLDFVVEGEGNNARATRIGWFYYLSIIVNAAIAFLISQFYG